MSVEIIKPEEDGVTHINCYSKGKTALGQFWTNFAYSPIDLDDDGHFESIEAYWYWLGTSHPDRDKLRQCSGFEAKKLGRAMGSPDWKEDDPNFKEKIKAAITAKAKKYPKALRALRESKLPLKHYYVYGGKVVEPKDGKWVIEHIESLRG